MASSVVQPHEIMMSPNRALRRTLFGPLGRLLRRIVHRAIALNALAVSFWVAESPVIFAAMATLSRLRVFDELQGGPKTSEELARAVGADEDALLRLLHAVSAVGLVKHRRDGRFALNAVAKQFCSDSPNPVGAWSEVLLEVLPLFPKLPDAVRAGQPLMRHATQQTCWQYLESVPEGRALHDRAMSCWSALVVDEVAARCHLADAKRIIDVGGGRGAFLAACLAAAPQLSGSVYDIEGTRAEAIELFRQRGLSDRAEHTAGDFFTSVPAGADVYSIKHVLHDWDDENVLRILRNIRAAMTADGRLLIVEGAARHELLPSASVRAAWDLTQWIATWGKERTLSQFQDLLAQAGFQLTRVTVTSTIDALILEAGPA